MRRILIASAALAALALAPVAADAQGMSVPGAPGSGGTVGAHYAPSTGGGGSSYVGPEDAFGSAAKYGYGIMAISNAAAVAQVNAFRLAHTADAEKCNVKETSTGHPATVVTGCSGIGSPTADGTPLATWCAISSGNCFGDTWFEQKGTGADAPVSGTAPTFLFNCIGTDPCFVGGGAGGFLASAATLTTQTSGLTISAVAIRTGGTGQSDILSGSSGVFFSGVFNTGNVSGYFGASPTTVSETENVWHAMQWYVNNTASVINLDGTENTVNLGAGDLSAGFYLFRQNTGSYLTGKIFEALVFNASSNSTSRNALCANQRARTGISGSCS